jgi:hypothetical protein
MYMRKVRFGKTIKNVHFTLSLLVCLKRHRSMRYAIVVPIRFDLIGNEKVLVANDIWKIQATTRMK